MTQPKTDNLDVRIRQALTAWKKLDETDVKILEGLTLLGPRNLAMIAEKYKLPASTVKYRVSQMLSNSFLFLHLNPYHTNMGLKKVLVFVEADLGYEDDLMDCLRVNDFWIFLCRIYRPYEGCAGIWTIPKDNVEDFHSFLNSLQEAEVPKVSRPSGLHAFMRSPSRADGSASRKVLGHSNGMSGLKKLRPLRVNYPTPS